MAGGLKSWELENAVELVDAHRDSLYDYNVEAIKREEDAKPWRSNPNHFKHVRISAVALLKMVMHARSGGRLEVMGMMKGYVSGDSMIVTDAYRLPVEGTETRVNAQEEALEYLVQYNESARNFSQPENIVGWYHSHPGYGCWLSGIDVNTQFHQQTFQDPMVAVVIDPDRTISSGKVDIGAFRTYPEGYKANSSGTDSDGFQTIPFGKIEDFGAYSDRYYALEVSHFKSSLDSKLLESLWNKYWVSTLSQSPLTSNRDYTTTQIADLAVKMKQASRDAQGKSRAGGGVLAIGHKSASLDSQLHKVVQAGKKIALEEEAGLLSSNMKQKLFRDIHADLEPRASGGVNVGG